MQFLYVLIVRNSSEGLKDWIPIVTTNIAHNSMVVSFFPFPALIPYSKPVSLENCYPHGAICIPKP